MDVIPFRVSVRVTNSREWEKGKQILSETPDADIHEYSGLITGLVTPDVLRKLMDAGLMVDRSSVTADDLPGTDLPGVERKTEKPEYKQLLQNLRAVASRPLMSRRVRAETSMPSFAAQQPIAPPASEKAVYDVQLRGPMRPEWGHFFHEHGLRVLSYAPPYRHRVELTSAEREFVAQQSFVVSVEPYDLADTVTPEFVELISQAQQAPSEEPAMFDLMLHSPDQFEIISQLIRDSGQGEVESSSGRYLRIRAAPLSPLVATLANRTEVKCIAPYQPPALACDRACALIGVADINRTPGGPWKGNGQIIGVLDSGIDTSHPDLTTRILHYQSLPGATTSDQFGHGTHVAGIIAGTGAASNGQITGVAPGAMLAVIGICNAQNTPLLPPDMGTLLKMATDQGAKIINLSLGFRMSNQYDQYAESIDEFVFANPETLVVIAAGNSGAAHTGWPDFGSIGTPATAKNAITVGACVTDRTGFASTWSTFNPAAFPAPPASTQLMTGPPVIPAGLSSRGPTDYYAFKPDVVAPGTYILSAQASSAALRSYAAVPAGTGPYMFLNGSSMATPFVSGAAAVIRHYLADVMNVGQPSAALLKALLCCSAVRCDSVMNASVAPKVGYPDFDQGAGRIDLRSILPHRNAQGLRLSLVDVANGSGLALQSLVPPNSSRRANRIYKVTVANSGSPLRVLLAWTDAPGRALQNTLQVRCARTGRSPGGQS